jgi:hypothetical protein
MKSTKHILAVSKQFGKYVLDNVSRMAESHIECWEQRYANYNTVRRLREDLYHNHDISLEIERAQEDLGRELTSEEYDFLQKEFNEEVIKQYKAKRQFK